MEWKAKNFTLVRGITYYFDVMRPASHSAITSDPNGGDTLSIINSGVTNNKVQVNAHIHLLLLPCLQLCITIVPIN